MLSMSRSNFVHDFGARPASVLALTLLLGAPAVAQVVPPAGPAPVALYHATQWAPSPGMPGPPAPPQPASLALPPLFAVTPPAQPPVVLIAAQVREDRGERRLPVTVSPPGTEQV